jgi:hypothetical protein
MHVPELSLQGCSFGSNDRLDREGMLGGYGIMAIYEFQAVSVTLLQILDHGVNFGTIRALEIAVFYQFNWSEKVTLKMVIVE